MELNVLITNNSEQQTITHRVKKQWICISYSLIIINRSYASNATTFAYLRWVLKIPYIFSVYLFQDKTAIIKGKNGENATFKALEPLLDKYIK